jgi:diphthine-ammonia ligase
MAAPSGIVRKGKLVSCAAWQKHIRLLRRKVGEPFASKIAAMKAVAAAFEEAVRKRLPGKRFGLLLSGGVDSSTLALLAKKCGGNFFCYCVGIEGAKDLVEAKKVAKNLNLTLRVKEYSLADVEKLLKKAAAVVGEPNVVNIGVAAVEIAAISLAKKDKISVLMGGLGSEEIFAGYQRHERAADINKECWNGLMRMWERDLVRDSKVAEAMNISFLTPFLDEDLIVAAMRVPGKYKIAGEEKKAILRDAAELLGLPKAFARRKKLAAQYGSGFDKAMEKLARGKGFRFKKDYLASLLATI